MKFNEKYKVNPDFEELFSSDNREDDIVQNAKNISARFLSEIEKLCEEKQLLKKDLAKDLGVSASYITQLFRGDKLLNLTFLSRLEDYFKISFEIQAKQEQLVKVKETKVLPLIRNIDELKSTLR